MILDSGVAVIPAAIIFVIEARDFKRYPGFHRHSAFALDQV